MTGLPADLAAISPPISPISPGLLTQPAPRLAISPRSHCDHTAGARPHRSTARGAGRAGLSEPEWYAAIGVGGRYVSGRTIVHAMSAPHPGSTPADTDATLDHALDHGPVTCERVETELTGGE